MRPLLLALCAVAAACSATSPVAPLRAEMTAPWTAEFTPPTVLDTDRVHLEPLAPEHVELDFAALMGSREHLQRTLRWGDWPRADFTLEENREDLARHWQEFVDREGYAYTVLSPDRSVCLGCVYLMPSPTGDERGAFLAYWVIEPELATDLDRHLLTTLLEWFESDWPFQNVLLAEHVDNPRGVELARAGGLAVGDPVAIGAPPNLELFIWTPDAP